MRKMGLAIVARVLAGLWVGMIWTCAALAQTVTIAALGDSLVHGYGLPADQGFVPQMQAALRADGHDVRLINAGVSGDTTAGGAARVDWTLTPDVAGMIVVLGGNDMLRGVDPAVTRGNLDHILTVADGKGVPVLLVGMQAPGNYGPDYKQAFDATYPDLAEAHGALLHDSFFAAFAEMEQSPAALQKFMQPDGIHPSAEGVAQIVAQMQPSVEALIARASDGQAGG